MEKTYIGLSKKISYILVYLIPFFGLVFFLKKDEKSETRYVGIQGVIIYSIIVVLYFIKSILEFIMHLIGLLSLILFPLSFIISIVYFLLLVLIIYLVCCVLMDRSIKVPILDTFAKAIIDTF